MQHVQRDSQALRSRRATQHRGIGISQAALTSACATSIRSCGRFEGGCLWRLPTQQLHLGRQPLVSWLQQVWESL